MLQFCWGGGAAGGVASLMTMMTMMTMMMIMRSRPGGELTPEPKFNEGAIRKTGATSGVFLCRRSLCCYSLIFEGSFDLLLHWIRQLLRELVMVLGSYPWE